MSAHTFFVHICSFVGKVLSQLVNASNASAANNSSPYAVLAILTSKIIPEAIGTAYPPDGCVRDGLAVQGHEFLDISGVIEVTISTQVNCKLAELWLGSLL